MARPACSALLCAVLLASRYAAADEPPRPLTPNRPSPSMDAPDPTPTPPTSSLPTTARDDDLLKSGLGSDDTSDLLVPTPHEWKLKYEEARAKLLTGEFADAAVRFAELESTAVNRVDRAVAREQRKLADEWTVRNLAFVHRADLSDASISAKAVDRRSTDELVSLYTNSVFYGVGSGIWLATLTKPEGAAAGILPALALTAGSIGTVIALDSGRGFRYGVPQSIVSGLYIGLEHGVVWTLWANARGSHRDLETTSESTVIWTLSTAGATLGGILGEALGSTPGRSSWVGSTTIWTGTIAGLTTAALVEDGDAEALAVAGVGLTAGTLLGLASASSVSPSIARVRLIDLAALLGGVAGGALYFAGADSNTDGQAAAGVTALGITGGLVVGWLATSSMAADRLRPARLPATTTTSSVAPSPSMRPMLLPSPSGAMLGVLGTLD